MEDDPEGTQVGLDDLPDFGDALENEMDAAINFGGALSKENSMTNPLRGGVGRANSMDEFFDFQASQQDWPAQNNAPPQAPQAQPAPPSTTAAPPPSSLDHPNQNAGGNLQASSRVTQQQQQQQQPLEEDGRSRFEDAGWQRSGSPKPQAHHRHHHPLHPEGPGNFGGSAHANAAPNATQPDPSRSSGVHPQAILQPWPHPPPPPYGHHPGHHPGSYPPQHHPYHAVGVWHHPGHHSGHHPHPGHHPHHPHHQYGGPPPPHYGYGDGYGDPRQHPRHPHRMAAPHQYPPARDHSPHPPPLPASAGPIAATKQQHVQQQQHHHYNPHEEHTRSHEAAVAAAAAAAAAAPPPRFHGACSGNAFLPPGAPAFAVYPHGAPEGGPRSEGPSAAATASRLETSASAPATAPASAAIKCNDKKELVATSSALPQVVDLESSSASPSLNESSKRPAASISTSPSSPSLSPSPSSKVPSISCQEDSEAAVVVVVPAVPDAPSSASSERSDGGEQQQTPAPRAAVDHGDDQKLNEEDKQVLQALTLPSPPPPPAGTIPDQLPPSETVPSAAPFPYPEKPSQHHQPLPPHPHQHEQHGQGPYEPPHAMHRPHPAHHLNQAHPHSVPPPMWPPPQAHSVPYWPQHGGHMDGHMEGMPRGDRRDDGGSEAGDYMHGVPDRRRLDRNHREQKRSKRIADQINDLKELLEESGAPTSKGNKSSVLASAAEYIAELQQRNLELSRQAAMAHERKHHQRLQKGQSGPGGGQGAGVARQASVVSGSIVSGSVGCGDKERQQGQGQVGNLQSLQHLPNQSSSVLSHSDECPGEETEEEVSEAGGEGQRGREGGGDGLQRRRPHVVFRGSSTPEDSSQTPDSQSNESSELDNCSENNSSENNSSETNEPNESSGDCVSTDDGSGSGNGRAGREKRKEKKKGGGLSGRSASMSSSTPSSAAASSAAAASSSGHINYQRVFQDQAVPLAITSVDGRFLDCNRRFEGESGYAKEELLRMTFFTLAKGNANNQGDGNGKKSDGSGDGEKGEGVGEEGGPNLFQAVAEMLKAPCSAGSRQCVFAAALRKTAKNTPPAPAAASSLTDAGTTTPPPSLVPADTATPSATEDAERAPSVPSSPRYMQLSTVLYDEEGALAAGDETTSSEVRFFSCALLPHLPKTVT